MQNAIEEAKDILGAYQTAQDQFENTCKKRLTEVIIQEEEEKKRLAKQATQPRYMSWRPARYNTEQDQIEQIKRSVPKYKMGTSSNGNLDW